MRAADPPAASGSGAAHCFFRISISASGTRARQLNEFLHAVEAESIVLVGDIVDALSLARRAFWSPAHTEVVRTLLARQCAPLHREARTAGCSTRAATRLRRRHPRTHSSRQPASHPRHALRQQRRLGRVLLGAAGESEWRARAIALAAAPGRLRSRRAARWPRRPEARSLSSRGPCVTCLALRRSGAALGCDAGLAAP